MNARRIVISAVAVLLLLSTRAGASEFPKFLGSNGTAATAQRYVVEIEFHPGEDLSALIRQFEAKYSVRAEPYAEQAVTGFVIVAAPSLARALSTDPRVLAVSGARDDVQRKKAATHVQPKVAREEVRKELSTDSVPGFGAYTYDDSGNITSINSSHIFRYDGSGRLIHAEQGALGKQEYTYDRYGNILTIVRNDQQSSRVILGVDSDTNQIDNPNPSAGVANVTAIFDNAGNVTANWDGSQYVYDALNVMKEATDGGRRLHVYTASDERVGVISVNAGVEAGSEWTLRDASNRVLRRFLKSSAGDWTWKEDYIYAGNRLLAGEVPGTEGVRHFHLDHLGTPRLTTGNGGVKIAEDTYEPFGLLLTPPAPAELLQFTGHERDAASLDYMHARYYRADIGRFLSVDPVMDIKRATANPQGWNRYSYVQNNPVNRIDPDGRDFRDYLERYRNNLLNAQRHFDKANQTISEVPVLKVSSGGKLFGSKYQVGPIKAEARVDVRIAPMTETGLPITIRGSVTGGAEGTSAQGGARLNLSGELGTVQRWTTIRNPSAATEYVMANDRGPTEPSNGVKSSNGQLMWTGSFYGFTVDVGIDFGKAARAAGELGQAAAALFASETAIKDHER